MAILKQRLHRKNDSGTYDTIYLENIATNVKLSESDSTTVATALAGKALKYHTHAGTEVTINSGTQTVEASINNNYSLITNLSTEVSSLKSSVSNGKSLIASAITDKGVSTASSATFQVMSDNIRSIPTSTTSGVSIWVYSEGMPSNGSITATKNGYTISATYVSTFNWFKIALPTSGYEGTWTITGSYGGYSSSGNCYVSGSTVRDYFLTVNVLPILPQYSKWKFNDTIPRPSVSVREYFDGDENTQSIYTYSWSDSRPNGYGYKYACGMDFSATGDSIVTYWWNKYEGSGYYSNSDGLVWTQNSCRIFRVEKTYTVSMAFYSYLINNATRIE